MADNLMQLQRQAAQRVQQMQEHSRRVFEAHQGELTSPGLYRRPPAEPTCEKEKASISLPHLEAEQWLLLGLVLLLMRCGGKTELMLALLYLAM